MNPPPPTVAELARRVDGRLVGDGSVRVTGVRLDSRRIEHGDLFAAVRGSTVDGHTFVSRAVDAGAAAVLVDREVGDSVPAIAVDDVRRAVGPIAHGVYGDPTRAMTVVGITGTNGKTTTSFLTASVLEENGLDVAILGTLGVRHAHDVTTTGFTTPEAPELARRFAELSASGIDAVSMEVSSHAIEFGRVRGVRFVGGVFTNLSREHLDFHGTMEAYGQAKLGFFRQLADQDAVAMVNADDPWGERFQDAGPERTWTFSLDDPDADVFAERLSASTDGSELAVRTPAGRFETRLSMAGRFNAANALAAAGIGIALGVEPAAVGVALARVDRVPGRCEVYGGDGVTVIVDYAHTPDAFERILETARETGPRRLFCIFGCGGDRDRSKRPEMARIAGRLADVAYVTVDNPRDESVERIMNDILGGFDDATARWERIDDRAVAVDRAIGEAEPGDVVCLLGKGDEPYQWIADRKVPYSDRDEARRALAKRERRS